METSSHTALQPEASRTRNNYCNPDASPLRRKSSMASQCLVTPHTVVLVPQTNISVEEEAVGRECSWSPNLGDFCVVLVILVF